MISCGAMNEHDTCGHVLGALSEQQAWMRWWPGDLQGDDSVQFAEHFSGGSKMWCGLRAAVYGEGFWSSARDSCSRVPQRRDRSRPQPRPQMVLMMPCLQSDSLRTAVISLRGQPVGSRARELAVAKELTPDWAPTKRRHRAAAQHGCVSEETEEQAAALTKLGAVADGFRPLLARPGSELALAERELWSRQQRWLDEFRDSLQARDTMAMDGCRWRCKLQFLLNCVKVARFLRQCSNFGTVAGHVLSAILPSSSSSVALKSLQTKGRPS